ncbi:hypothetical protein [Nocardia cyriacigeorgica]|uniref:Secreted protein n=1 Tax=Nocardia cyriacigeorgica TaxID=135487 RepID=A0A5R8P555_9NOCA|nr:hypothetical protein [Nocardia cyriacigeorgica]TLF81003.1 hypothetical protein FEK34_04870 [Nocardia cyriacigeorgica]TLF93644.1 hypothetical protein FEK35_29465 [Nocardia cyriacigeorgica]
MKHGAPVVSGTLLAALVVVLSAGPAAAARGGLVVDGTVHHDPVGCLEVSGGARSLKVENHTDVPVTVYYGRGCRGDITATLTSREVRTVVGTSIQVP